MCIRDSAYSDLSLLAARRGLQFLFESTVMDGAPVFNLARYCLRGSSVLGFKGILNSTTNFVIGEMEKGHKFNDSVIRAMKLGFAEADPSMDLEGWDAAVKTAVLSNVLLGADITPKDVERAGITQLKMCIRDRELPEELSTPEKRLAAIKKLSLIHI